MGASSATNKSKSLEVQSLLSDLLKSRQPRPAGRTHLQQPGMRSLHLHRLPNIQEAVVGCWAEEFGKRESKARGSRKAFSEKEEKVLMRVIKQGKEKCVTKLARKLSRPPQSVRDRIKKLKTGNPLHTIIRFTAEEDNVLLLVIREGKDGDVVRLAKTLDRSQNSVRTRVKK